MKIVEENPAPLTNSEVLRLLKERIDNASAGSSSAVPSEKQLLEILEKRGTPDKSREEIEAFVAAVKNEFTLTTQEVLQLVNHAPSHILEAYLCVESAINSQRVSEDDLDRIVELVAEHLK